MYLKYDIDIVPVACNKVTRVLTGRCPVRLAADDGFEISIMTFQLAVVFQ